MKKAPLGVTIVAVLTMLSAVGAFFFAVVWVAFSGMGHAGAYIVIPTSYWVVLFSSLFLSGISFLASVGMFQGASEAWYLSIIVWVFSAAHWCYAASLMFGYGDNLRTFSALAILVNAIFIVYFQSKQVKDYFLHTSD
jgi:nicotinamide riboside transporter PnuC